MHIELALSSRLPLVAGQTRPAFLFPRGTNAPFVRWGATWGGGILSIRPQLYRDFAATCLKMAEQAASENQRALLKEMAVRWHGLATDVEKVGVVAVPSNTPESDPIVE